MLDTMTMALPASTITPSQSLFFAHLAARTHLPIAPLAVPTYAGLQKVFEAQQAQLMWAPPMVALEMIAWGEAVPLAVVTRGGRTSYPAVLVAREDEEEAPLESLLGGRIAWVSRLSAAGYVFPRLYLESIGAMPARLLREPMFLYSHAAVLRAVQSGEANVGATYARLVSQSGRLVLPGSAEGLRVVAVTGFVPNEVILASTRVSALDRMSIAQTLRSTPAHELRLLGGELAIDRFSLDVESHLEPLRRLTALGQGRSAELAGTPSCHQALVW